MPATSSRLFDPKTRDPVSESVFRIRIGAQHHNSARSKKPPPKKREKPHKPTPANARFTPQQVADSPAVRTSIRFDSEFTPKYWRCPILGKNGLEIHFRTHITGLPKNVPHTHTQSNPHHHYQQPHPHPHTPNPANARFTPQQVAESLAVRTSIFFGSAFTPKHYRCPILKKHGLDSERPAHPKLHSRALHTSKANPATSYRLLPAVYSWNDPQKNGRRNSPLSVPAPCSSLSFAARSAALGGIPSCIP